MDQEGRATSSGQASYRWVAPGKPVSAELDFDVVDRLLQEALRGFGHIPRKGVEVGGLLLGSSRSEDGRWVVSITDFEPVPCRHARGHAWLLDESELARLEEIYARWRSGDGRQTYAVGLYRSHTRGGLGLTADDLELYHRFFPEPWAMALLVKPFATRVSTGAFFFREDGVVRAESSYAEFPFNRKALGGGEATVEPPPAGAPQENPAVDEAASQPAGVVSQPGERFMTSQAQVSEPPLHFTGAVEEPPQEAAPKRRSGWVWIPLSFIFLLLGVILGFQVALSVKSRMPAGAGAADPYSLRLEAAPSGESSIHVRWDRNSPAIQAATSGVLHITDGGNGKQVKLDAVQLHNGSVVYRKATADVAFRLEVFTSERVTISESVRFR